ncbi:MAG: hypothetical protein JW834_01795 [Candidatus Diapherotrites archaeon]|nr:hypothetical protein [Candidatus Diapherotrites archaeon]
MQKGQAFDAFKLLIAAVVAGAILVVILGIVSGAGDWIPLAPSDFDASQAFFQEARIHPAASTKGTVFNIIAEVKMQRGTGTKCSQPAVVQATVGDEVVTLYDDGQHNDGKKRDCTFVGLWDSIDAAVGQYEARITVADAEGKEIESEPMTYNVTDNECVTIQDSGNPDTKLDIVFVGDKYEDLAQFDTDVDIHSEFLISVEPFDAYKNKINIHRVRARADLGCSTGGGYITCNDAEVERLAAQCPYDEIIVLVNTGDMAGTANPHAYAGHLYPEITVHEFGHSFGPEPINLADEYSYEVSITLGNDIGDPPNCDFEPCAKWAGVPGTGCEATDKFGLEGCSYTEWRKPTKYDKDSGMSIMEGASMKPRNDPHPTVPVAFDPVSVEHIKRLLEAYS